VAPAGAGPLGAGHVIWTLGAVLAQLLVQCWIVLFGLGSLRLLRQRGDGDPRLPAVARAVIFGPLALVGLSALAVASGIRSYAASLPSSLHGAVGWTIAAIPLLVLAWEWRALERLERLMAEADDAESTAGRDARV
jgi:hypothetical protein